MPSSEAQRVGELHQARRDLADYGRRVLLMEGDRHRLREMAELFEEVGANAESAECSRLAGDEHAPLVIEAALGVFGELDEPYRAPPHAEPDPDVSRAPGPRTEAEVFAATFAQGGDGALARYFGTKVGPSEQSPMLPIESYLQLAARFDGQHGPLPALRAEMAWALLRLGEDGSARTLLEKEAERERAPLRSLRALADIYEAEGKKERALALHRRIAEQDVRYPGSQEAITRLSHVRSVDLPRYHREAQLADSKTAQTWRARDTQLDRAVVLKQRRGANAWEAARLEATLPARIGHPGLVRVLDADQRAPFVVLEALRCDLRSAVEQRLLPDAGEAAVRVWGDLTEALHAVHQAGYSHRAIHTSHIYWNGHALRLGNFAHASTDPGFAPDDVSALAQCMRDCGADAVPASVLSACLQSDPSARPTAHALLEALRAS